MLKKIVFLVVFLLIFSSCAVAEEPVEYIYTEGFTTMAEPCGKAFLFPMSYAETSAGENTYRFSPEIPVE